MTNGNRYWQVIEDNGGTIYLVVFDSDDNVIYFASGQEIHGTLLDDLEGLRNGDDTSAWERQVNNPQQAYNDLTSSEHGWHIIADTNGTYLDNIGNSGIRALWPQLLANRNPEALLECTLDTAMSLGLDWYDAYPVVDNTLRVIAIASASNEILAGYADLNQCTFDDDEDVWHTL